MMTGRGMEGRKKGYGHIHEKMIYGKNTIDVMRRIKSRNTEVEKGA